MTRAEILRQSRKEIEAIETAFRLGLYEHETDMWDHLMRVEEKFERLIKESLKAAA